MADKTYKLTFGLSDGSEKEVAFTVPQGATGKSAYEYAQEAGYEGTEEEFSQQLATGGAEEIVISATEPTDENVKIWINPEEEDEANGGGSGSGTSIDVTAEVGQTIRVKAVDANGKPTAWEAVDFPEGVSSWNDLTDKPFNIVELMPKTELVYYDATGIFTASTDFELAAGRTYIVNWNGVEYTATASAGTFVSENIAAAVIYVGNPAVVGGENNGLPFAVARILFDPTSKGVIGAIPLDGSTSVSVGIKGLESPYVDSTGPLVLDALFDETSGELTTVYATPEQIFTAFMAGRQIVIVRRFSAMLVRLSVSFIGGNTEMGEFFYLVPSYGNIEYSMKYNGDGTYVVYSD